MRPLTVAELETLGRYDTPTVCNVIELFAVRPQTAGYLDKRIQACYPDLPPMVGYASTATFRSALKPVAGGQYGSLDDQVERFGELPGPPVVVFQDLDSPAVAATYGEVMTTTYKTFGAVGLITSGAGRDHLQVKALDFPCFCDGYICSHGYPMIGDLHVPVHVGGVEIRPGDLLHGDANGVTTIPHDIAPDVVELCPELVKAEDIVLEYLRCGKVTPAGYAEARKSLGAALKALKDQVRGHR